MNKRIKVIFGILIALVLVSFGNVFAESCTYSKGTRSIQAANGSKYELEYKTSVTIDFSNGKVNSAHVTEIGGAKNKQLTIEDSDKYGSSCPAAVYYNKNKATLYPKDAFFAGRAKLKKVEIYSCSIPLYYIMMKSDNTLVHKLVTNVSLDFNTTSHSISPYVVNLPYNQKYTMTKSIINMSSSDCSKVITCAKAQNNLVCVLGDKSATAEYDDVPVETDAGGNVYTGDEYLDPMGDYFGDIENPGTCDEILDGDAKELLIKVFNWIRILTPVILIVIGALDFAKAILAADDKQMAMATRNFVTRCIVAVLIFFVPLLVYYFLEIALTSANLVSGSGGICNFLR